MSFKDRLSFIQGDGLEIIHQFHDRPDIVFFVDPPYTASQKKPGNRLYNYSNIDHHKLFKLLQASAGDFVLTYDNTQEMRNMAEVHGFEYVAVPMKNTHHQRLTELLISKDLTWLK